MSAVSRSYTPYGDSPRISQFLAQAYPKTDCNPNWTRARWEYMVYAVQDGMEEHLSSFCVWERGDEIVGLVNFEDGPGEVYLQVRPGHTDLRAEMLDYAETALCKMEVDKKQLTVWVNEFDNILMSTTKRPLSTRSGSSAWRSGRSKLR